MTAELINAYWFKYCYANMRSCGTYLLGMGGNEMTKDTQPEALRLAEIIGGNVGAELRRLHAENEALRKDAERY